LSLERFQSWFSIVAGRKGQGFRLFGLPPTWPETREEKGNLDIVALKRKLAHLMALNVFPPAGQLPARVKALVSPRLAARIEAGRVRRQNDVAKERSKTVSVGPVKGFLFHAAPSFDRSHFEMLTKSKRLNEQVKHEEALKRSEERVRMQKALRFSREEDIALVLGHEKYRHLDEWALVIKHDPAFARLTERRAETLKRRFEILRSFIDDLDELVVRKGANGHDCVVRLSQFLNAKSRKERKKTKEVGNYDYCHVCNDGGLLLCCDNCALSFHKECIDLEEIPQGDWVCPVCMEDDAFDFVDDCEMSPSDWEQLQKTFKGVVGAKKSNYDLLKDKKDKMLYEGDDGNVTRSLKQILHQQDPDFDRITKEIEREKGFITKGVNSREESVIRKFVQLQEATSRKRKLEGLPKLGADTTPEANARSPVAVGRENDDEDEGDDVAEDHADDEEEEDDEESDDERALALRGTDVEITKEEKEESESGKRGDAQLNILISRKKVKLQ